MIDDNLGDALLQIRIQQLVGVQLRRIAGQVEDLDLVLVFREPLLYSLRVMHPEVVQDQKHSRAAPMHKPLHEADQNLRIQRAGENLPAHLALVGHRRNHTQLSAIGVGQHNRSLSLWRITTAAHVVRA